MRRLLIRTAILIVTLGALLLLWIFCGRGLSLFLDRFGTAEIESHSIAQLSYEGNEAGGTIEIAGAPFSTAGCDLKPFPLTFHENSKHEFVVSSGGKSFPLGSASPKGTMIEFVPQSGDKVSLGLRRSFLSWPTPFELNFMTGHSPSWKRNVYHVLDWRKASGQQLEIVWRYEQFCYPNDGWTSPFMTREGATGLIRVKISP